MGKFVSDASMDALLDEIATCTRLDVTSDSATPTNLTNTLADVTITAGDGGGDFTVADGAVDGRKLTITQQADILIDVSGTAKHIVLSLGGTVIYTTTCTDQALVANASNTVTVPAITHTVRDPS